MPAPEFLPLLDAALRGALVAVLLLVAAGLRRTRSAHAIARVGQVFMPLLAVQAVIALPAIEAGRTGAWQAPFIGLSVGNSVMFWLFSRALFDDDYVPRLRHAAIWAGVVLLGTSFYLSLAWPGSFGAPGELPYTALHLAMRWVPVLFAVLALAATVTQWRGDLVERRRRLRLFILLAGSAYTLATAAVRLTAPMGRLSPAQATLDVAALLLIVACVAALTLQVSSPLLPDSGDDQNSAEDADRHRHHHNNNHHQHTEQAGQPAPVASPQAAQAGFDPAPTMAGPAEPSDLPPAPTARTSSTSLTDADDLRLARALARAMDEQQAYRDETLGIASLAARLGVAEYRLRRHINQQLGHRNFNAYVNGLRITHACRALADPAQADQPVLSLALDAGFGSVGPFNRAFKAATGVTPSDYRRRQQAGASAATLSPAQASASTPPLADS